MEAGEKLQLKIDGVSHEGSGVARFGGLVIFVEGALPGETVMATLTQTGKTFVRAEATEILNASRLRAEPFCRHYADCGGCSLQHSTYEGQLEIKRTIVTNALERIGKFAGIEVSPVIGMDQPYHYRNKAEYRIETGGDGRVVCGFRKRSSHECVDISECKVVPDISLEVLSTLREELRGMTDSASLGLRHAVVRTGSEGKVMLSMVSTELSSSSHIKLANRLNEKIPALSSINHSYNRRSIGEVMGWRNTLLYGVPKISQSIGGFSFSISPTSFLQVNSIQVESLYKTAVDFASIDKSTSVLDLYCGIGTITLLLAQKARKVLGIESNPEAVRDAFDNAQRNDIGNASFKVGRAEALIRSDDVRRLSAEVAVIDPPRAGCEPSVLDGLSSSQINRIVYISCDPATLARDAARLSNSGFAIKAVQPIDMFPHTSHVECVVLMSRTNE
jgi:23S rRNA (uracil1939-C5)-methyltransferase